MCCRRCFVAAGATGCPGACGGVAGDRSRRDLAGVHRARAIRAGCSDDERTHRVSDQLLVSRFAPMPGWTRNVEKDGAGRTIAATWSGGSVAADEYQDFVFMGRTPREPGTLVFPAYQTYQDGETVAWNEAPDQEHPAATVEVVAADAPLVATETHMEATTAEASTPLVETLAETATSLVEGATPTVMGDAVETAAPAFVEAEPTPLVAGAAVTESGGSDLALFVALGALVLGLLAVALAVVALMRRPAAP